MHIELDLDVGIVGQQPSERRPQKRLGSMDVLLHHVYALAAALDFTKVGELLPPPPQRSVGEELKMTLSNQALSKQTLSEHAEAQVTDLITSALAPRRGLKAGS